MLRLSERAWGWIGPLGVTTLAFVVRVWNVGKPSHLLFDETYYAKHAWSMLEVGYARDAPSTADDQIARGITSGLFTDAPTQVAHPEAGKWLIALGERAFGMDAFGWRIASVVVGALTVLVLARLVRRLTGSTWLGCLAGLLLCVDGMHFVMSRLALLDGFLTFWILSGIACIVADRDRMVTRLDVDLRWRPVRPWQLLAGVCFGMAVATKWSGLFPLAVAGLLVVGWEAACRWRSPLRGPAGSVTGWWIRTLAVVGAPAFASLVLVAAGVYLATWTGWLLHHEVYAARFDLGDGNRFSQLWQFHLLDWRFHTGDYLAGQTHPYQSEAWGWPLLNRPVGVEAQNDLPAAMCDAGRGDSCIRVITLLGNPLVWWLGSAAVVASAALWVWERSWHHGLVLAMIGALWLPWFRFDDRPIFSFYAVTMLPLMIVAIALVLREVWDASAGGSRRMLLGGIVAYLAVTVALFWWFHPIWTGETIPRSAWAARMWFSAWI
ncbi:MAG: phospholipid carrier-dependent glycosyltransferase [Aeromicrobium sp.]|uniref:dolichyl-phosphate-mannose--protein mannosyltransferase n=1 Tax=Aeromicrobium sp. TaxID=1871063 RepID=UPI0039E46412